MKQRIAAACAAALLLGVGALSPAHAEGLGAEGNYARASGNWGAELGAGYELGMAGFSLTPGVGLFFRDGDTALYGRIEAAYQLPASLRIGLGLRLSGDDPRPYATVAMPLLPKVAVKGNVGPHYVGAGLTIGY
ncbi:MAG TPA: hypothetical protein VFF84_05700 [Sphingobium sp.]|nr:hypothetical protein [Sphingobium sp.]